MELLISKVLLAAAKVAEKIVDVVHEKIVEKEVPVLKEKSEQEVVVQKETLLPKKPEEPLLLSKYPLIMKLDVELQRRNKEIFAIEQERGNLEIELFECIGAFKQKKELQERITFLDKKVEKMKAELSQVLRNAGYVNAAEFFTELFTVREEKRKYNCNGKRKTEEIRWIICYIIQCRYIGFIKPNNVENNYEYGESMKKLVILRGNSGSGKTTVAKALQRKIGFNTMLISQDEIRRNMLWVKDGIDTKALPLMIELLKYGNEHSAIVILEGIMYDEWYSPLFNVANELYGANVYSYYFDVPFEETVRRHQTRSKSQEFGEEHMRQWWREKDFSSVLKEEIISCEMDADGIVEKVYADLLEEE